MNTKVVNVTNLANIENLANVGSAANVANITNIASVTINLANIVAVFRNVVSNIVSIDPLFVKFIKAEVSSALIY